MTFLGLEARTDLPEVSYPTALDYFVFISFMFIFSTVVQVTIHFNHLLTVVQVKIGCSHLLFVFSIVVKVTNHCNHLLLALLIVVQVTIGFFNFLFVFSTVLQVIIQVNHFHHVQLFSK